MSDYILGRGRVRPSPWAYLHDRTPHSNGKRAGRRQAQDGSLPTLAAIADPENLLRVFLDRTVSGGQAAGLDGIHFADVSETEAAAALRQISRAIHDRTYRPYPTRPVHIAKSSGGRRTLCVPNIFDRVVDRALTQAVTPIVDQVLFPGCHGYRRRRSIVRMLADAAYKMTVENRFWIVTDDIRDAFPSVRVADAVADYVRIIPDDGLMWLIERVLRGAEGLARTIGIDQGSALSPLTLNFRLSTCLDRPFSADPDNPPWYRWADDLAYLCRGEADCHRAIGQAAELLRPAGFTLKGISGRPTNLRRQGARVEILGYWISYEDGWPRLRIPPNAWHRLREELELAWAGEKPCELSCQIIRGWLTHYGVAVGGAETQRVAERVMDTAAQTGFREIGGLAGVVRAIHRSRDMWDAERWQAQIRHSSPQQTHCAPRVDRHVHTGTWAGEPVT